MIVSVELRTPTGSATNRSAAQQTHNVGRQMISRLKRRDGTIAARWDPSAKGFKPGRKRVGHLCLVPAIARFSWIIGAAVC